MSSLFKKSEEQYCQDGLTELGRRRLKEAEAVFNKGIKAYPNSFALHANRANIWLLSSDYGRAVEDLTVAIENCPTAGSEWALKLKRGTCYVRLDRLTEALTDLDQALSSAPAGSDKAMLASGYFYRALIHIDDNPEKALADAKKAVEIEPADGRYRKLMADVEVSLSSPEAMKLGQEGAEHLQSGQTEKALECFEALLALEPDHSKAWQLKGAALHRLERYEEELVALNRSYELNGNEVALFNRAACLIALGRLQEARSDLTRFIQVGTHAATVQQAQLMLSSLG